MKLNLIIPAAGEGTRLRPLSSNTSKTMVRVNGRPCLEFILDNFKEHDVNLIIVDGKFDDIREYCALRYPNSSFVKQEKPTGPHDAISLGLRAPSYESSAPTVIWLGDTIVVNQELPFGNDFLLVKENVADQSAWCIWDGEKFYNKPKENIENGKALVGVYSFANGLDAVAAFGISQSRYDISSALEQMKERFDCVVAKNWYDIGELDSYYKTCAALLKHKARAFNRLEFDTTLGVVTKSPDFSDRHSVRAIMSEIEWYKNVGYTQSCFVPQYFEDLSSSTELTIRYENSSLLQDVLLYDNLSEGAIHNILSKIFKIKEEFFNTMCVDEIFIENLDIAIPKMWQKKSEDRLIACRKFFYPKESILLKAIIDKTMKHVKPIEVMHGDLHSGNILYSVHDNSIKFIDPRGEYGDVRTTHGDDIYDYAKLAHDLYWGYTAAVENTHQCQKAKKIFVKLLEENNKNVKVILEAGLLLLATCIPLHSDDPDRQERFAEIVRRGLNEINSI
jgi:glucose-1-phosphate thymidylyltransferase